MTNKLSILVLCGGQSTEHDISLLSARNVTNSLDPQKYQVSVVRIEQDGSWLYFKNPQDCFTHTHAHAMHITPGQKNPFSADNQPIHIDCIFPILHGTNGEDGAPQGLFELLQIPYVGADILGSAVGMDKELLKRLLENANLPVVDRFLFRRIDRDKINYQDVAKKLGKVVFVKPNSLGSAIGVNRATDEVSFKAACDDAFRYDEYILVEKAIVGREVECSVLGNENPRVSPPGEIIKHTEFYSFDAKYVDATAATVKTPADLPKELITELQALSLAAYETLRCSGMARVDFFVENTGEIYINEINTIPGFTNISMYPKNWEASGLSYQALLDELIQLAMDRAAFKQSLVRVFKPTVTV